MNTEQTKIFLRIYILYIFKKGHDMMIKLAVSTFCQLRPKSCVLAGRSVTYSFCVCTIDQNVKLMSAIFS